MQDKAQRSPCQMFTNTKIAANPKQFECPVYALDSKLQRISIFHKWKQKSEVAICLGASPLHNNDLALVLSRATAIANK